jgi:hypothetical protein
VHPGQLCGQVDDGSRDRRGRKFRHLDNVCR